MAKGIFFIGIDIEWDNSDPKDPNFDRYREHLEAIVSAGCTAEGLTYTIVRPRGIGFSDVYNELYELEEA
jgi:hypothetical protein